MKVIVVSQIPPPVHGSTVMTERLMGALRSEGHDVGLVDRRFSSTIDVVGQFRWRKVVAAIDLGRRLRASVRSNKPDTVVFFATDRSLSFLVDVFLAWILRRSRARTIVYLHTTGWARLGVRSRMLGSLAGYVLRTGTRTVVLGESLHADAARAGAVGLTVIPNCAPDPGQTPIRHHAGLSVVYLGNLLPAKGYQDFLELAHDLEGEFEGATFHVAGAESYKGQLEELRAECGSRGSSRTLVRGRVNAVDRDALLRSADVLVFPSRFEAQPLVVIEALSFGVPVVAYDVGGLRDLIADDVNGFLLDLGDCEAMTEATRRILSDQELRVRLGRGARDVYLARHAPSAYARAWGELLEREHG